MAILSKIAHPLAFPNLRGGPPCLCKSEQPLLFRISILFAA